jgi:hypothetical protein
MNAPVLLLFSLQLVEQTGALSTPFGKFQEIVALASMLFLGLLFSRKKGGALKKIKRLGRIKRLSLRRSVDFDGVGGIIVLILGLIALGLLIWLIVVYWEIILISLLIAGVVTGIIFLAIENPEALGVIAGILVAAGLVWLAILFWEITLIAGSTALVVWGIVKIIQSNQRKKADEEEKKKRAEMKKQENTDHENERAEKNRFLKTPRA